MRRDGDDGGRHAVSGLLGLAARPVMRRRRRTRALAAGPAGALPSAADRARDGGRFRIVKFRTMRPEAWPGEPDADRDTPSGRTLRAAEPGRAAAAVERAARRHEPDRSAADTARAGRALLAAPARPARDPARADRLGPGQRPQLDLVAGADRAGPLVHRAPLAASRRPDRRADRAEAVRPSGIYGEGGVNQGFPMPDDARRHPTYDSRSEQRQPAELQARSRPRRQQQQSEQRRVAPCATRPTPAAAREQPDRPPGRARRRLQRRECAQGRSASAATSGSRTRSCTGADTEDRLRSPCRP